MRSDRYCCDSLRFRATLRCQPAISGSLRKRPQLHDALGAGFADINRSVAPKREIVNGMEHGIARLSESDRRNDVPLAVEFKDARMLRFIILAPDPEEDRAFGV